MSGIETLKTKYWYDAAAIIKHAPIGALRHAPTGYVISVYKPIPRFQRLMLRLCFGLKIREVMSGIEELAKEYAEGIVDGLSFHHSSTREVGQMVEDAYMDGVNTLMSFPLTDRLTAEEKERMRKIYYDAERGEVNGHYDVYPDPCDVMRVIFGKDFFKEGE